MDSNLILKIILIGVAILIVYLTIKHIGKQPKDSIVMFNGPVGCGKTSTGLYVSLAELRKKQKKTKFKNKIRKLLKKKEIEIPYIYSNIPLYDIEYKEFTIEHLMREKRFDYNSVTFLNECSLIADSMLAFNIGKDEARRFVNDQLKLFCKLIRHETKGKGICMVLDTQNPNDLALAGDRVLSTTNIILDWINWIPFVRPVKIRQIIINMEDVKNNFNEDTREDNSKWILVPKSIFKKYNSYCYEFLTRDKPVDKDVKYIKTNYKNRGEKMAKPFIIPTVTQYKEIMESNEMLKAKETKAKIEKIRKEKKQNGENK